MATYNPYEAPGASYDAKDPSHLQGGGEPITPLMIEHLQASRPWLRLLSILGFILSGLIILGSLSLIVVLPRGASPTPNSGLGPEIASLLVLPFSIVYFLPALFLHRFANSIDELVLAPGARSLENTLHRSRSFWKILGVMVLIMITLWLVFFIISIITGARAASTI